jgi:predicted AAA+ superfamily ATPase
MISKRRELFNEYMEFGGFPEVALTNDYQTTKLILKNIFASFFEKDIKVFFGYRHIKPGN